MTGPILFFFGPQTVTMETSLLCEKNFFEKEKKVFMTFFISLKESCSMHYALFSSALLYTKIE